MLPYMSGMMYQMPMEMDREEEDDEFEDEEDMLRRRLQTFLLSLFSPWSSSS